MPTVPTYTGGAVFQAGYQTGKTAREIYEDQVLREQAKEQARTELEMQKIAAKERQAELDRQYKAEALAEDTRRWEEEMLLKKEAMELDKLLGEENVKLTGAKADYYRTRPSITNKTKKLTSSQINSQINNAVKTLKGYFTEVAPNGEFNSQDSINEYVKTYKGIVDQIIGTNTEEDSSKIIKLINKRLPDEFKLDEGLFSFEQNIKFDKIEPKMTTKPKQEIEEEDVSYENYLPKDMNVEDKKRFKKLNKEQQKIFLSGLGVEINE